MLPSKYTHNLTTFPHLLCYQLDPSLCQFSLALLQQPPTWSPCFQSSSHEACSHSCWNDLYKAHITSHHSMPSILIRVKANIFTMAQSPELIDLAPCYLSDLTIYHPSLIHSASAKLTSLLFLINTNHPITSGPLHVLYLLFPNIFAWLTHSFPSYLCSNSHSWTILYKISKKPSFPLPCVIFLQSPHYHLIYYIFIF